MKVHVYEEPDQGFDVTYQPEKDLCSIASSALEGVNLDFATKQVESLLRCLKDMKNKYGKKTSSRTP